MNRSRPNVRKALIALAASAAFCLPATRSEAQLRVATWNISNYSGGRTADIQTAVYAAFQGRSMKPDVLIGQEFISAAGVSAFLNALNTAPGSPGDWAAAPFINGPDTDSAFFYRTSRLAFLGVTVVAVGGGAPNHPRNIQRYDIRPAGYASDGAVLACYSTHMKAGSTDGDQARRLVEAERIRDDAEMLIPDWHFLLAGDMNIQSSSQAAYQELTGSQANNDGRFFDPIRTPGDWNNNGVFRYVHTQDPIGAGGMDDRHDQILVSESLIDGDGFDYLGNPLVAASATTWDDPNHSYRAWGNDGTSFNTTLTVTNNQMVGETIAQALINAADGAGHLPVFLDFRVPPAIDAADAIDFGQVEQGSPAVRTLTVSNAGDVALWSANGIAALRYSMTATAGFSAPTGTFTDFAGGGGNEHEIVMNTDTPGLMSGTLTVASNAPDAPIHTILVSGEVVVPQCVPADADCDGLVAPGDADLFAALLLGTANPCAPCAGDLNDDGRIDGADAQPFVEALLAN